jgi:hypothetical protein
VESDRPGIDPPTFRQMFMADENVRFVVNQYNDGFREGRWAEDPGARLITTPLEKLRPMFVATSATSVDTTVNTEFSPNVELRTRGFSPGMARTLLDLWISRILDQYGNLLTQEATYVSNAARVRADELKGELGAVERQRELLDQRLALVDTQVAGLRRALTSARPEPRRSPIGNEVLALGTFSGARETSVTIQGDSQAGEPGLIERAARVRVQLNIARQPNGASEQEARRLELELEEVEAEIGAIETQLGMLGEDAADLAGERGEVAVELARLENAVRLVASQASQAEALRRQLVDEPEGWAQENYSTLRVLAEPVVPNERVWPKRTFIAGGVAFAVFLLLVLGACSELYLRRAIVLAEGRKGLAG